ncbi:MAG: hypothetical protein ACXV3S_01130 [Kineosporiaceae bacterium]
MNQPEATGKDGDLDGHQDGHQVLVEKVDGMDRRLGQVLTALERSQAATAPASTAPAWRRVTDGEERLPVAVAILVMIALQSRVPARFTLFGPWVLPSIEAAILLALVVLDPRRITRTEQHLRTLSLTLLALASLSNAWAAGCLVVGLVRGTEGRSAEDLLTVGGNIWLTNILIFALWYWDLDRGGPAGRAQAVQDMPDFVFPQMTSSQLASPDWEPTFGDYLYLAFTNATAFSPTDTMPFSRWSKLAMGLQSAISLCVGALIVARAVNILQ